MELRYPFVLILGIIAIILLVILTKKKIKNYDNGHKIANTKYLKQHSYYKERLKKYNTLINIIKLLCLTTVFISVFLLSRMAKIETVNTSEYNRDIYLCMDVSDSVNELNLEIVKNMKETVKSLKEERFGISIFNSSNVILVPLTDDYEYVLDTLEKLEKAIEVRVNYDFEAEYDSKEYNKYREGTTYLMEGTIEGSDLRGSSLIGDGLASCVYSFPKLEEEERTRIIIFSTDNELAGKPLVTLDEAADISIKKKVTVYGIGTTVMSTKDRDEFKRAVEKTGGEFYEESKSSVKSIVKNIEKHTKTLREKEDETYKIDIPQLPFIMLIISFIILIYLETKVIS